MWPRSHTQLLQNLGKCLRGAHVAGVCTAPSLCNSWCGTLGSSALLIFGDYDGSPADSSRELGCLAGGRKGGGCSSTAVKPLKTVVSETSPAMNGNPGGKLCMRDTFRLLVSLWLPLVYRLRSATGNDVRLITAFSVGHAQDLID